MINDVFGVGVAAPASTARASRAAHTAAPAAAPKHAAATDASVDRNHL
ncbi:hypothetical protein BN971_03403 [Mycobacterium bohemicum DSM 44277]|uniref:Uncharacterized protein n=1 Tax=Mycobacterium bohemicum DSM 44277 TaxID=1236609 RepID=A0A0U0WAR4_MYCBE|nr:hypothetical protein BN971_03403 [Mycobacterium bohemicum DSM 44277]